MAYVLTDNRGNIYHSLGQAETMTNQSRHIIKGLLKDPASGWTLNKGNGPAYYSRARPVFNKPKPHITETPVQQRIDTLTREISDLRADLAELTKMLSRSHLLVEPGTQYDLFQ